MNRDKISLDDEPIILDRFAAQKARRLNIILWSSSCYIGQAMGVSINVIITYLIVITDWFYSWKFNL